jgi:hypothetical protein
MLNTTAVSDAGKFLIFTRDLTHWMTLAVVPANRMFYSVVSLRRPRFVPGVVPGSVWRAETFGLIAS